MRIKSTFDGDMIHLSEVISISLAQIFTLTESSMVTILDEGVFPDTKLIDVRKEQEEEVITRDPFSDFGGEVVMGTVIGGVMIASVVGLVRMYRGHRHKLAADQKIIKNIREVQAQRKVYDEVASKSIEKSVEVQQVG